MNNLFPQIPETLSKRDLFAKDIFCALMPNAALDTDMQNIFRCVALEQADLLIADLKATPPEEDDYADDIPF